LTCKQYGNNNNSIECKQQLPNTLILISVKFYHISYW